jgi:transposase-like protein
MSKRGRKPKSNLGDEACPNPECPLSGMKARANIVSNGTYRRKGEDAGRRFLCRACGHSFCSRAGTIFYDLRSPEDRVLKALKLLVKGMPLRGVAEVLGVKLDTVRHWLRVAAEQSEKLDAVLLKELQVSQVELDALWTFVKKNSLRQRALLWKARFGSALPLPPSTA